MKLCGCINGKTIQECKNMFTGTDVDLIEHRIDYLEKGRSLNELYDQIRIPIIAACPGNDGRLKEAIESGCSFVDIDQASEKKDELIKVAKDYGVKIILSYHDYEETPTDEILHSIIDSMTEADIIKIVTTPNDIKDSNRVLQLYFDHKGPLIAFCMGKEATFTRAISLIYGAPFTYVSLGEPTAPGQIDAESMRELLKVIM